jgi:hypothetical protein
VARQNKPKMRDMLKWLVLTGGVVGVLVYTGGAVYKLKSS